MHAESFTHLAHKSRYDLAGSIQLQLDTLNKDTRSMNHAYNQFSSALRMEIKITGGSSLSTWKRRQRLSRLEVRE